MWVWVFLAGHDWVVIYGVEYQPVYKVDGLRPSPTYAMKGGGSENDEAMAEA